MEKINTANIGLNLDSVPSQLKEGQLSYALNAVTEGFDGKKVTYQNEQANELVWTLPSGYKVIGQHIVSERGIIVYLLANPTTGASEIGKLDTNTFTYSPILQWDCLKFDIDYPVHKIVHKTTSIGLEIYWTDSKNVMRFLDIDNPPSTVDCNLLSVQPNYKQPKINYTDVGGNGDLTAGTYQFAIQYSDPTGGPLTAFHSVSNPISINDKLKVTQDFDYKTNKSIELSISNIDTSGVYQYFNLAVIKTVNNIPSAELVGTYRITKSTEKVTYTGEQVANIRLTPDEIFEKFPRYDRAGDLTVVGDIILWADLITAERINYQSIWNKVSLQWQTWKLPYPKGENYSKPEHTAEIKGYFRDEVYAFGGQLLFKNGGESDVSPIPNRIATSYDLEILNNTDVISQSDTACDPLPSGLPRWRVYNTATLLGTESEYDADDDCYIGPHQYGSFAYWESTETYPNTDLWGELKGLPIRHHKFPDSLITHIHDHAGNIYPLGVKVDIDQIKQLIAQSDLTQEQKDNIVGFRIVRGNRATSKSVIGRGLLFNVGKYEKEDQTYFFPNYPYNDLREDPYISISQTGDDTGMNVDKRLKAFDSEDSKKRFTFHSPDTHFYQPHLGSSIKIETIEYGNARGHFVPVKQNARYRILSAGSYTLSLAIAVGVGVGSGTFLAGNAFSGEAAFAAFNTIINLIDRMIPKINYAYQFNSVADYKNFIPVPNEGNKNRFADILGYLIPGMTSLGDTNQINNYQRESSVYIRTTTSLPFPSDNNGPIDQSRWTLNEAECSPSRLTEKQTSAFYATIKRPALDQYGRINSYETIDTGAIFDLTETGTRSVFGGDCFINKFALKRKFPFFLDNRVNFPDEADIDYRDFNNIGFPTYWFSTDSRSDETPVDSDRGSRILNIALAVSPFGGIAALLGGGLAKESKEVLDKFKAVFGVKRNNFDCRQDKFFYQGGKFYLFAYGIPYFFCESEVNVDYRQAFNDKEGDFYPHVGEGIPDEWLQEYRVPIAQDNTYFYNKTFSKQNKENIFYNLPEDFDVLKDATTKLPNSVIYSDPQGDVTNYRRNNWRIYRPVSIYHFPFSHGKLTSIETLENSEILARFENKSLLYNRLITIDTSSPKAVYIGNDKLFTGAPPIDFVESDTGYNGSQHKFFLKTPYGAVSVDSKRKQIFLIAGTKLEELSSEQYNLSSFFQNNLDFYIRKSFPTINIDNHFKDIGLTGVFDVRYNRLIITKKDYLPLNTGTTYINNKFYLSGKQVYLEDPTYFCDKSFTISFDFDTMSWISLHSYIPNHYTPLSGGFVTGNPNSVWLHGRGFTKYNSFYGKTSPYVLEYPLFFSGKEHLVQSISDSTKVYKHSSKESYIETNDTYFNKSLIYTDQYCSGIQELVLKDNRKMSQYLTYPRFNSESKSILYSKVNNFYNYNQVFDAVKDHNLPIFVDSCSPTEIKTLNISNMNYKNQFNKSPIRGEYVTVRHILDNKDTHRLVSEFIITETQEK